MRRLAQCPKETIEDGQKSTRSMFETVEGVEDHKIKWLFEIDLFFEDGIEEHITYIELAHSPVTFKHNSVCVAKFDLFHHWTECFVEVEPGDSVESFFVRCYHHIVLDLKNMFIAHKFLMWWKRCVVPCIILM